MAPEVVGRKGYNWTVDWWSLGITAYELLFNKRPFNGRTGEKMTQSILNDPLVFPDDQQCSEAGLSALRGVRSFSRFIPIAVLISSPSSLTGTQTHAWVVGPMATVSKTFVIIPGSHQSTGILLRPRNANHGLSPT